MLKSQINPANKKVYFKYNNRGDLLQTWGDTTYPLEYVYDSYGHRTELHSFRGGQNWSASSWPAATTGAVDVTKWMYQESTGLLIEKQDAVLKGASYTYDELGRVKTRTWERNITCTYGYDANTGELSTITYSDGTPPVAFTYDRGGRQTNITDAAGTHTLTFNVAGELQTEQITGGILDGVNINVGHDGFLRRNSLQTSHGANTLSSQTYGYDGTSRLETITSGSQTATYVYYPNTGLLNTTTFTGGTSIARSYDGIGRLENITNTPAADQAQSFTYTYNNLNQRTRVTREDGSYWSYIYNDRGELDKGKKYWVDNSIVWGAQTEYKFDNLGNRNFAKSGGNQLGGQRQSNYSTNSLNQYSQRVVPGAVDITGTANTAATVTVNNLATARKGEYFYGELAVNNSTTPANPQINVVGARANFGAGGEDAVTQKGGRAFIPQTPEVFIYDDDGNLTSDGRWNYNWDGENRLLSMEAIASVPVEAKQRLEFAYDHLARRIQKKVYIWNVPTSSYQLQSVKKFVYDGWLLFAEVDGSGALVRGYAWGQDVSGTLPGAGGIGGLLLVGEGGNTYQVGYDGNGNVTTLVKSGTNTISAQFDYDPFGNTLRATGDYASQNPFRFSTKYADQETGFYYYGYRYYDPQTGRWINRDPSEETGGVNLYGMVSNNPITNSDPYGLAQRGNKSKCCCCVEDLDVITSGQFKGNLSILTYFPYLRFQRHLISQKPREAGPFVNNSFAGAQVQIVSKVSGPGKKCNFSQHFWTELFQSGTAHLPQEGTNTDDFLKNSHHDQSKPPFRQYINGNPSMADPPVVPRLTDSHVIDWYTTCLNSGGDQASQECKSKQCCVKWKLDVSTDSNKKTTPILTKVDQWCN